MGGAPESQKVSVLRIQVKRRLADFPLEIDVDCRYTVTAVYGPSGSGKTSLLNLVAGLLRPDAGEIELQGSTLFSTESGTDLPPEERRIGYVLQDDLLFPHMTVAANLRYGLERLATDRRRFEFDRIVDLLEVRPLLERYPSRLSGGERQRVALGRALLSSPNLLLMDEPLASLDQGLKSRIIPYLRYIRRELQIPILYVTHSVAEILELTGQVIVLQRGQVLAHGDFFRIASQPGIMPLLEEDYGFENVLPVEMIDGHAAEGVSRVRCFDQELLVPYCAVAPGRQLFVGIRADDIVLARQRPEGLSIRNAITGKVVEISKVEGGTLLVYVDVGRRLAAKVTGAAVREMELAVGDQLYCLMKTHSIRIGPEVE
jgi:molybdate transport system ATP-binding protein